MHYLIIGLAAFLASGLTLFSGFGLGTLLLPVMALFFPVEMAIALTAIVHFLNNLFKLVLLGRYADRAAVWRFGLPAIGTALLGAEVLLWLSRLPPVWDYHLLGGSFQVLPVKLVVAGLIVLFAGWEFSPALAHISLDKKYLPLGGILSGFFGGLSGHQGALRSAFLLQAGLTKESFIATGVVISLLVDIPRIAVYSLNLPWETFRTGANLLLAAVLAAFSGAFLGNLLVKKVTLRQIQLLVAVMLLAIAVGLASGFI
jgi:uncharacterized membrane protein YfcA